MVPLHVATPTELSLYPYKSMAPLHVATPIELSLYPYKSMAPLHVATLTIEDATIMCLSKYLLSYFYFSEGEG